jgi:hypothetical protein
MKLEEAIDINVCQPIAVGHHKVLPIDILFNPLDPSPRHGLKPGLRQRNLPIAFVME